MDGPRVRVRCQCGKLASTNDRCKSCTSDHPMRHWHPDGDDEEFDPTAPIHAHPHDGQGHNHLGGPEDRIVPAR